MKPQELSGIRLASALAGRTAHDLNNLLAIFSGHLFLLRSNAESPEEGFAAIEQATEQLQRMTRSLLVLASLGREGIETFELNPLVGESAAAAGAEADLDPSVGRIAGRKADIRAALDALLTNARESGPSVGPVRVTTRSSPDGLGTIVTVEDTGSGIQANLAERMFDPLFSTREKGRGIGLTVAAAVAVDLGGVCEVENRPGGGARALLRIPTRKENPSGQR